MIVSDENVPIGKRGRGPGEFIFKQRRRRFDQMHAAKLPISCRSQLRPNKVALIGVKKDGGSIGYQVDTGPLSQARHHIGLPDLTPGSRLKADKQPSGTGTVNKIISEKRRGGVAENAAGSRWS